MLSNINQCLLDILLYNPYYFKQAGVPYNIFQKLYIIQFINRGILYLSVLQSALLFGSLKLFPKPKYWARNKFFTLLPYTQATLTLFWITNRFIYPNEGLQFVFPKQIDCIQQNQLLNNPLLYNRNFIANKLTNFRASDNSKSGKASFNQKLKDVNQIILDPSLDSQRIRKVYPIDFDQELYRDIELRYKDIIKFVEM